MGKKFCSFLKIFILTYIENDSLYMNLCKLIYVHNYFVFECKITYVNRLLVAIKLSYSFEIKKSLLKTHV